MRLTYAQVVVVVGAVSAQAATAPASNVATAAKNLETARANLAAAIKKIEGDAPVLADLEAAHTAVEAVKDAIDSGAAQEPNDLDYARNALAARKEVREKRDYIESRRAKMHIFNNRRTIDAAVAELKEKQKATDVKEPSAADFENTRAAIANVRKAVEPARQFISQDADFGKFVAGLDAELAKTENAVDTKWAALEGGKHKARVEEARAAYTEAFNALKPTSTDAEFKNVETLGKTLQTRLDEGKVLESKDKNYGPYAATTRANLVASKKKADELWSKTGVARLKAEIEPTAKDLAGALKVVRQKKPAEDQLAEARTIAIVARKTLEKYASEAERSEEFGAYVATVNTTLTEVEGQLQLKSLDLAQREFRNALARLDRKPTDEDFQVANSSLLVLQKTLEPMNAKDPLLTAAVTDARAWEREGKATIAKRRSEVSAASQQATLTTAVKEFRAALGKLDRKAPSDDDFAVANSSLLVLTKTLEPLDPKNPLLAAAIVDARAWEREGKQTITKRRTELDVAAQQAKVETTRNNAQKIVDTFPNEDAGDDTVKQAEDAVKRITEALDQGTELTKQDRGYAAYDREVRKRVTDFGKKIDAKKLQLFAAASRNELRAQLDELKEKVTAARAPASTDADVQGALKQYDGILAFIEGKQQLAQQAGSFASAVDKAYYELQKRQESLLAAQEEREIRRQTTDELNPGIAAFDEAASAIGDIRKQKAKYEEAQAHFKACKSKGEAIQENQPQFGKLAVVIAGLPSNVAKAIGECGRRLTEVEPLIKPLAGLVFVEDRPKKSYAEALAATAKDKKLTAYENCAADAVTAAVRYPDLKERFFEVGKEQMLLSDLSKKCAAEAKKLRGK